MTANEYFQGYAPKVTTEQGNPEALKYGKMWEHDAYRAVSPGQELADVFLACARPPEGATVIDFGCGTGRGGLRLALRAGLRVIFVDFVRNCLDADVKSFVDNASTNMLQFVKADLEKSLPVAAEYGYCTDVMEHIPPDKVDIALNNILRAAQHVFFSISNQEDNCGKLIGEPLHMSVHPYDWWLEKFTARDCKIHYSEDIGGNSLFYVTAWQTGQELVDSGRLNTEEEQIRANVRVNSAQDWQQISPHESNDLECMILGGGPSIREFIDEIKQHRQDGVKLITMNGSYNWALGHGLTPSAQIVVDARTFNARFTKPVVDGCKYLIASQCDPSVFDGLPKDLTYIWHTTTDTIRDILDENYKQWWAVPGGSTVLLRAIPMMRMLGYSKFILYGCDSCLGDCGENHVYSQPENENDMAISVIVNPGGRIFRCAPWMASQATEFLDLIKFLGDEIELEIRGDGLLSHILNVGAEQADIHEAD